MGEFGSKSEEPDIKSLKFFMTEAINEGIEIENEKHGEKRKLLTSKQVGRILTEIGFSNLTEKSKLWCRGAYKQVMPQKTHYPRRIRRKTRFFVAFVCRY